LARSIGVHLAHNTRVIEGVNNSTRDIPSLLATVGLCHDLGNPPFGHQGEAAIQHWVNENKKELFGDDDAGRELTTEMQEDFLRFEGNAQTLRLLTRLQIISDDYGLNLTYATLSALMKYPVDSKSVNKNNVATKKHGFFQSEKEIVREIWKATGLKKGVRHPMTFVMEACDDIAYSVMDAEDAVKKKLASFSDLMAWLEKSDDIVVKEVVQKSKGSHAIHEQYNLSPAELNDVSMQMFRVWAIGAMVKCVSTTFVDKNQMMLQGKFKEDLIDVSGAKELCRLLKGFDKLHAYKHRSVVEVELTGYNVINDLMTYLWKAIKNRKVTVCDELVSDCPYSNYVYSRISENYRRVFFSSTHMPVRYREIQLVTDMISGMTDSFAVSFRDELASFR
jgi:dGTPase